MDTRTVQLLDVATGLATDAVLYRRLTAAQVTATEAAWKPPREALGDFIEHAHWDWTRKIPLLGDPRVRFVGIEFGADMQGMMAVYEAGHTSRIPATGGEPVVYVEYVEAAPWNLRVPGQTPRFRSVGLRLLSCAVSLSLELGHAGRIGLVALPQAEAFYQRTCGMTPLGPDSVYEGLCYYELGADQVHRLREGE